MKNLKKSLLNNHFSHIYVEESAYKYNFTNEILENFPYSSIINIKCYKDVFNRVSQNIELQKLSKKLILAEKKDFFYYKMPDICNNYSLKNAYYTSCILNCLFNCSYCFLPGMYRTMNIVVFVNYKDFFNSVKKLSTKNKIYLAISYDTDILAFENTLKYTNKWLDFAIKNPNVEIEIRTKSANYHTISEFTSIKNVTLSWTLSPNDIINKYELQTPSLESRINSLNQALNDGWKVMVCIDPIIYCNKWKTLYNELIDIIDSNIDLNKLESFSLGTFRMPKNYLNNLRNTKIKSDIIYFPYETKNNIAFYNFENELLPYIEKCIKTKLPSIKIYT